MSCVKSESFPIGRNNPNNPRSRDEPLVWNSPFILVQIRGVNGTWLPVRMVMDTGAVATVLNRETTDALGFKPSMGRQMPVLGVAGGGIMTMMQADVKIGRFDPMTIDVLISEQDNLNLLGVEDLLTSGRFEMKISSTRVILYDRQATDCDGGDLPMTFDVRQEAKEDGEELSDAIAGMLRGFSAGSSDNTDWYFDYY